MAANDGSAILERRIDGRGAVLDGLVASSSWHSERVLSSERLARLPDNPGDYCRCVDDAGLSRAAVLD